MNVSLILERRDVYNVIGTIYGKTEPGAKQLAYSCHVCTFVCTCVQLSINEMPEACIYPSLYKAIIIMRSKN